MNKKIKAFDKPLLEVIYFSNDDIITLSEGNILDWGNPEEERFKEI